MCMSLLAQAPEVARHGQDEGHVWAENYKIAGGMDKLDCSPLKKKKKQVKSLPKCKLIF